MLFASTYTRTFAIKRLLSSHATFVYCFHNHRRSLCEKLLWRCLHSRGSFVLIQFSTLDSSCRGGRSTFACNCCHFSLFKRFFSLIFMRSYRYCCICAFCSSRTPTQTASTDNKPQAFFTDEHSTMILFHFAAIFSPCRSYRWSEDFKCEEIVAPARNSRRKGSPRLGLRWGWAIESSAPRLSPNFDQTKICSDI